MADEKTIDKYMTPHTHTVGAQTSLLKAEEMMAELGVRHLPVLEGGKLVGVLSDRDVIAARRLDHAQDDVRVEEACSPVAYTAEPGTPLAECVNHMAEHHLGCVVIAKNERVLGIFTTTDACRLLAERL